MTDTNDAIQQEPTEVTLKYLSGEEKAPTAEALMRARYSAYVTCNIAFLENSLTEEQKTDFAPDEAEKWAKSAEWIGLEIIEVEAGQESDEHGIVEFKAFFKQEDKPYEHHEKAGFVKVDDAWYYAGSLPLQKTVRREDPKVGRNDPCPCGSGKKFKKCCG